MQKQIKESRGIIATLKENDGCAWVEDGFIIINFRWAPESLEEIIEYINRCFIHEFLEHFLKLGHELAEKGEKILFEKNKK